MNLKKATFQGKVKNEKLVYDKPEIVELYLSLFPEDATLNITIARERKGRSINQNSYYWGVIIPIMCEWSGYTPEEMHDALKWQFLRKEGKIPTTRSTAELSTVEFENYASAIRQWASVEHGIFIPLPNENEIEFSNSLPQ